MPRSELAHLEVLAEVDALVGRLNRWADGAPDWAPAEKCKALVRRLADRADSLRVRLESPLVVATLGGTGAGKSALVNALLGADVVRTGRSRPTTTRPTLLTRPGLTPQLLGIDPASVEWIERDLPALRDLVLVDCPDPDTSEEVDSGQCPVDSKAPAAAIPRPSSPVPLGDNLARLRAILPKCDVLLVTATQQKYRSARVGDELAAAAHGAKLVFVQTRADLDADIREDWRRSLDPVYHNEPIFRIDSLRALADAQANIQPRGEFADLLDLLTRQMAGAAGNRIRRVNFLDLAADTLDACNARIEESLPSVRAAQIAIEEQRGLLGKQLAAKMQAELLANRRPWENRLLGQAASRWGFSPFSLLLRMYQGIGGLFAGAMLYRMRTPAQMAIWGTMQGVRTLRRQSESRRADKTLAGAAGWEPAELRKATIILEGYVAEAGMDRRAAQPEAVAAEAESAAAGFIAHAAADVDALIARLAQRHTGWFTRWRYEFLLLAMLGVLLYRGGKNFFYDSWLADKFKLQPVYGTEFYISAGFWLLLWCLLLLWAFCSRLRGGLQGEISRLAADWSNTASTAGLFAGVEADCRRIERFRQELDAIRQEIKRLQRELR
jgi:hypothetical protein